MEKMENNSICLPITHFKHNLKTIKSNIMENVWFLQLKTGRKKKLLKILISPKIVNIFIKNQRVSGN